MSSALSIFLNGRGHDVRPFLPLYGRLYDTDLDIVPVDFIQDAPLPLGPWNFHFSLFTASLPETGQSIYLVDQPHFFHRDSLYTADSDEHLRYIFFSRAVIESCQRMGWAPQVFHLNDWQTALIPLFLRAVYNWDSLFAETRTLLTIHNIGYQGSFPADAAGDLGLEDRIDLLHQEDLKAGVVNSLKTGVLYADALSTVSKTYALEIQTDEYGVGLHHLLRERRDHLFGIVNGVDYDVWSPEKDSLIPYRFSLEDRSGKEKNKRELLESLGLTYAEGAPAVGIVSRLTFQKGFDLLFEVMPALLAHHDMRFVVLGTGESKYVEFFGGLQRRFPDRVCFYHGYNDRLAHLIEAGCDLFLMPSRYEPCGLNQMYSLRYGTIPVVRRTGGLADTVSSFNPATGEGTGFLFDHFTPEGLAWALRFALRTYEDRSAWDTLQSNAMAQDFSWSAQGRQYEALYRRLAGV